MKFIGLDPIPPSAAIIEMTGTPLGFVDLHNSAIVRALTIEPSTGVVKLLMDVSASVGMPTASFPGVLVWEFHGVCELSEEPMKDGLKPEDFVEWSWWLEDGRSKVFIGLGDRELYFECSETLVSLA